MLAAKSQKNNGIPYSLTQRNWECQAGMECIMHPGKELGQCVDIDECTASILHSTPCIVLLKYCRSSHHQRSFETPFAGSALYWCFAGILWSKHNVHKQVQLIKHFCVSKPKASIAMSKNPKQKSQPFLLLKRWLVLVPLQPRIHRFPRRGLKFCLLCYLDAKLPNCEKKIPWTSLNRLAVMIWMSVPTTRTLPPIVDQTTKAVST